jgi:hypothetical protein
VRPATTRVVIITYVLLSHRRSKLPHLRSLAGIPLLGFGRLIQNPGCFKAHPPSPLHRPSRRGHRQALERTPPNGQSLLLPLQAPRGGCRLGLGDLREVGSILPKRLRAGRARRGLRRLAVAILVIRL